MKSGDTSSHTCYLALLTFPGPDSSSFFSDSDETDVVVTLLPLFFSPTHPAVSGPYRPLSAVRFSAYVLLYLCSQPVPLMARWH